MAVDVSDNLWTDPCYVEAYLGAFQSAFPMREEHLQVMVEFLAASGRQIDHVIDVGCGDGVLAEAILDRFPDSRVTLADISSPMLDAAQERLRGFVDRLSPVRVDLHNPGWCAGLARDGGYAAVVSGYAIHHATDARKQALFSEIFRLLSPQGVFVNIDEVALPTPWLARVSKDRMIDGLYALRHRLGPGRTREQVAAQYLQHGDADDEPLASVESQCQWLRDAGFQDVDCYCKIHGYAVFGGRRPT